jgi:hypothetical protein
MTRVVGLDLSLASTGVAVAEFDPPGQGMDLVALIRTDRVRHPRLAGHPRMNAILADVAGLAGWPDLVVVEGPSYGSKGGHDHERGGLWWKITGYLHDTGFPYAVVPPATLKMYATGKGNAGKDEVLAAVIRRYPAVEVAGNDEADALVLAAMGCHRLDFPLGRVPASHSRAMVKVPWPELKTAEHV